MGWGDIRTLHKSSPLGPDVDTFITQVSHYFAGCVFVLGTPRITVPLAQSAGTVIKEDTQQQTVKVHEGVTSVMQRVI